MPTVFLTHTPEALEKYYGTKAVAALQAIAKVQFNTLERELTSSELANAAKSCQIIVSYRGTPGGADLFAQMPHLVAFSRCAIDIRNVDVDAASRSGILITQASAGFVPAVTEWALAAMVDIGRGITAATMEYRAGRVPKAVMGTQLAGATVGVIGYGQTGRRLCELCQVLGMRVLTADPHAKEIADGIAHVKLATLLEQSDFVVCLATATDATENMMNAEAFRKMKPGSFFVNASRGNLVDEAALVRALDSGHLAACALDVGRAPDQMPMPAVAAHPRVIATPHLAGLTPQAIEHQSMETVAQVAEILQGKAPNGSVNAEKAARLKTISVAKQPVANSRRAST
jgi:D-3-phosphoglycerate dehydrogenase